MAGTDRRITGARSAFVSISDLIEQLEEAGSEHSIAVAAGGDELIVANPYTLAVVGVVELLAPGGAVFRRFLEGGK